MAPIEDRFQASKKAGTLLVLFIPSVDRDENAIDHQAWVVASLKILGTLFGGATAFPQGHGVWRDDSRAGHLIFDEPTLVQSYTDDATLENNLDALREFVVRMGRETKQSAVGLVLDGVYYEIRLEDETP